MKDRIIFFNSPNLGGAERSIVHQSLLLVECHFRYVIPFINTLEEVNEIKDFLVSNNISINQISYLKIDQRYFSISRKNIGINLLFAFIGFLKTVFAISFKNYLTADSWWINGNKIALPLYVGAILYRYKKVFIWHFRDYPSFNTILKYFIRVSGVLSGFTLKLIGNSYSVTEELLAIHTPENVHCVYNPIGKLENVEKPSSSTKTIGVVAMLAPWKGIHQVIIMSSLYQDELKEMGVQFIDIYGDDIYKTKGDHVGYKEGIKSLLDKFPSDLIRFKGREKPEVIFSSIDLLIHSTIKREPFGRVIIEAFHSKVPVISTALGGAGELIGEDERGMSYHVNDYVDLFLKIKESFSNDISGQIDRAHRYAIQNDHKVKEQLSSIFL